ncbi:hypothetical protein JWF35_03625 [Clostridium botulinum]|uniref:hypothetical protein n=2 Tax=Clostridium botulinum TaxID=1491 RepID=UPI00015920BC|nr:hypothetical protein [Clostridium botulinum]ABS33608.1 conserved hypothetical protein [Clostridium botulinum A str. ATCC 19397]MBO3438197.1 hypothetical protein [Clostridium botulinum]QRC52158.1 hypothetical protein JMA41_13950 [Clostridium botulinum]
MIKCGQGLLLEMDYADGERITKKRPFLVIEVSEKKIKVLNVSSSKNKEHKLGFKSNKRINKYNPPFLKPSFVKLDALYIIEKDSRLKHFLLNNGRKIFPLELENIIESFYNFKKNNTVLQKNTSIDEILKVNAEALSEVAAAK